MARFYIQEDEFNTSDVGDTSTEMPIDSRPRPYVVEFATDMRPQETMQRILRQSDAPLVIVDDQVQRLCLSELPALCPTMSVHATEEFKSLDGALSLVDFLDQNRASRTSMLFAVGGGVVQDVTAFASCVYKRGVPWTYIPTTLLAQGDSCIGAKSGLNYKGAKNLLGVFSAPRRVVMHAGFLASLPLEDRLSGLGEIFRLSIIGGEDTLALFRDLEDSAVRGDPVVLGQLIRSALQVKRAVIERDEFELDLRRAMNFGHSVGHALEALTEYEVPHGIAVAIGVLIESAISVSRGLFSQTELDTLLLLGEPLIPARICELLQKTPLDGLLELLARDKKAEASSLKLVLPERVGRIRFVDLKLDEAAVPTVQAALDTVLGSLQSI